MSGWFRWLVVLAVFWVLVTDREPPTEAARPRGKSRITIRETITDESGFEHTWREPAIPTGSRDAVVSTWTSDKGESALDASVQVRLIPADRNVDAVFVIDTTSSMGWVFESARAKALEMAKALEASRAAGKDVRAGLIEYKDRGDRFDRRSRAGGHIRVSPLTSDWGRLRDAFGRMRATGGGDAPEDVQGALLEGLDQLAWRRGADTTRVIFLIGDAPAQDYPGQPGVPALGERLATEGFTLHAFCASPVVPEALKKLGEGLAKLDERLAKLGAGLEKLGLGELGRDEPSFRSPAEADFRALATATGGSFEVLRRAEGGR